MLGDLLRHQVALGDLQLLLAGVAGDLQHLHAVEQRRGDRIQHVRRRDEDDVRQIEVHLQVVVGERRVLFGVEDLQQRGRGIAAEISAQLVDLVEHEHRIPGADPAHALNDPARERADVGAAVPAHLRLVTHAAQRYADELASQRARDRLAERGLADAGRPDQAEDRPLLARSELAHRQVLEDALLHLLEVVVIGIEDLARLIEVQAILGALRPGQLHQPLEVGALHRVLRGRLRHLLETLQLLARRLLDVGRHLRGLDLLLERVEVAGVLALPELVLDRLQLLAEDCLALVLGELLAHLQVDLLFDLDELHLALQQHEQPAQPLGHIAFDQQGSALVR